MNLKTLRLNADVLFTIPAQYTAKMNSLTRLDFEVFNDAKFKDVVLFAKNLPEAAKLDNINLIDQRSMPSDLN